MIVEQFIEDIQKLINRGTINPSAEIGIRGEMRIDDKGPTGFSFVDVEFDDLEIGIHESSYNKLALIVK